MRLKIGLAIAVFLITYVVFRDKLERMYFDGYQEGCSDAILKVHRDGYIDSADWGRLTALCKKRTEDMWNDRTTKRMIER